MGTALKVIGVISIVVGIILSITLVGAVVGIPVLVDGIVLFAIGAIYQDIKDIKKKLK